jgi:hypothetical protein
MNHERASLQYWVLHVFLLITVVYFRFDSVVISVAVLIGIFSNLGTRSVDSTSAYSIFNRGFQRLLGDIQPDAIDRQLRGGGAGIDHSENGGMEKRPLNMMSNFPSKFINRPCPCGSGLKAKKCCASSNRTRVKPSSGVKKDEIQYDSSQFEVLE